MSKLKSKPEDFRVEEISDFNIGNQGDFSVYELSKTGIGTPEAINATLRYWNLSRKRIEYGGLKDRHAITTQLVTVYKGPREDFSDRSFSMRYLGRSHRHFTPKDIAANRFAVCLRNISIDRIDAMKSAAHTVQQNGVMNYFDDQRFGSVGKSGQLIGHPWCLGDFEKTLYLMLAEENSHDRGRERSEKQILRDNWGDWPKCKSELSRSHRRSIVSFLCDHPTRFKKAVGLIRKDLRSIYLAAFQSMLWNRWLSESLPSLIDETKIEQINSRIGPLRVPSNLDDSSRDELAKLSLPLPSSRQKEWPDRFKPHLDELLDSLDLTTQKLRLKYPRDTFFSRGQRRVWLGGESWQIRIGDDDQNERRKTLTLCFELPRGAYATMIIKSIQQTAEK